MSTAAGQEVASPPTATVTPATDVDAPRVEVVKASFNLPRRELDALKRIAAIRGVNATQALRQAIALLAFLTDLPRDSKFFVRESNGDQREVVFHNF